MYYHIYITFSTKDNTMYHIIVADTENKKGVVKLVNTYHLAFPKADKLILAFPDGGIKNIDCKIPFLYCTYPGLEIPTHVFNYTIFLDYQLKFEKIPITFIIFIIFLIK